MKLRLLSALLLLAGIVFFSSCERELSFENGGIPIVTDTGSIGGTALFSLSGGSGNCTGAVINGTYTAGTPVTAENSVVIEAEVDSIGTYTVSTSSINGVAFSGSGNFTDTGLQHITLTATGAPETAGAFNIPIGSGSCSFSITIMPSSSGAAAFTFGSAVACSGFVTGGTYTGGIPLVPATNTATFEVTVTTPGSYTISTQTENGITFSKTGSFTTTGIQSVVLEGSGTPTTAGIFTFEAVSGVNNCNFTVTVIAPGPVAEGTIDCTGATISGIYTQGITLGSSNTVSIPVNVTAAGSYLISTTLNGSTFSGSGTLASGSQTILLTGSGTPVDSGPFSFPVTFGASSCSFSVPFLAGTLPATDYLRVKIDGVLKTFNVNLDGDITALLLPNSVAVAGDNAVGSDEHIDVTVQSATPITPGTYLQDLGVSFSTSRYYDPVSGQGWQAGASSSPPLKVVITSITSTRVTGTFSGQFFDFNGTGTNAKQLTEGEFSVPLP